jgi:hypothetical protein
MQRMRKTGGKIKHVPCIAVDKPVLYEGECGICRDVAARSNFVGRERILLLQDVGCNIAITLSNSMTDPAITALFSATTNHLSCNMYGLLTKNEWLIS